MNAMYSKPTMPADNAHRFPALASGLDRPRSRFCGLHFEISTGEHFEIRCETCRFEHRLADTLLFFRIRDRTVLALSDAEFARLLACGEARAPGVTIHVKFPPLPLVSKHARTWTGHELTSEARAKVDRQCAYVHAVFQLRSSPPAAANSAHPSIKQIVDHVGARLGEKPPSVRTVHRWMQLWRRPLVIVSQSHRARRRRAKFRQTVPSGWTSLVLARRLEAGQFRPPAMKLPAELMMPAPEPARAAKPLPWHSRIPTRARKASLEDPGS